MNKSALEILACPACKGELTYVSDAQELVCRYDRLAFPIQHEIPVMLESKARKIELDEI